MNDQLWANCCLGVVCLGWPGLWAFVAWNVARHGVRGWARQIVYRLKTFQPPEG